MKWVKLASRHLSSIPNSVLSSRLFLRSMYMGKPPRGRVVGGAGSLTIRAEASPSHATGLNRGPVDENLRDRSEFGRRERRLEKRSQLPRWQSEDLSVPAGPSCSIGATSMSGIVRFCPVQMEMKNEAKQKATCGKNDGGTGVMRGVFWRTSR
jgi:hypothetical protein